jgi:hypothetical protein
MPWTVESARTIISLSLLDALDKAEAKKGNSRHDCGKIVDACSPILAANRSLAASVRF